MELNELIQHLVLRAPGFARRLKDANLDPNSIRAVEDLNALPVVRKDHLVELQKESPPFGGFLACAPGELKRVFQSPGPINDPESRVADYWRWKSALEAAGFRAGDVAINCFGYHLTPAGAMFEEGLWAVGCAVIPGGVGNQEQQARVLRDLKVNAYVGLPSYLKALIEKAAELNLELFIEKAFFTAEPLPPSLRTWLNDHGVKSARQGYGTAECGNLGYECDRQNGLHIPDDALVQICDINSGEPLPHGEVGEIVTTLFIPDYALIRFGTGDLSAINPEPCACGRASLRMTGWQGRIGDAVKVRGMFLHPRQLRDVLGRFPEVTRWQAVITRVDHRDFLTLNVAAKDDPDLKLRISAAIRDGLKFHAEINIVGEDQIPPDAPPLKDERTWE
jgi:phenylacetate-CoA ligase